MSRVCTIDRFEGRTEARGPVSIFPLSGGVGGRLEADHGSVNEGRLAPPESAQTGWNRFWELWLPETRDLRIERKRRLLHNFFD